MIYSTKLWFEPAGLSLRVEDRIIVRLRRSRLEVLRRIEG
jgi:hypothetical protein